MQNDTSSYSPWLHRLARLTAGATFLLIIIGGIVTGTDSGLAVPDWPTTFGYNMFLYPLSEMVGGILYEHSHRLMGSLVGLLTVGLFVFILAERLPEVAEMARSRGSRRCYCTRCSRWASGHTD